ncbi:MAG TPA: acyl carrier protein [Gemmatimonadales bacterium]|nr:acyl carrier protein [Gemmatimonadales bacterium]
MNQILERTRAYVRDNFLYMRPDLVLGDDDQLLAKGVIDSMGVMEMIGFLTSEFGIAVADEEVTEENLGSLSAIARFVTRKARQTEAA